MSDINTAVAAPVRRNPFASAVKTLFPAPSYYSVLSALYCLDRRALPTGRAGLLQLGIPAETIDAVFEAVQSFDRSTTLGILVLTERLFGIRELHYPDEAKLKAFYRENKVSAITLKAIRARVDKAIQAAWPDETMPPIVKTPFDLAFENSEALPRKHAANRSRRRAA